MNKVKETLLVKYSIGEYLLAILGIVILYKVGKWFWMTAFEDYSWEVIAFVLLAMAFGAILVFAPLSLLDWARSRIGMETRTKKLMDKKFKEETGIDPNEPLI